MQIVWKAAFFDITGYGSAARGYALSLDRLGVNIRLIPAGKGSPKKIAPEAGENVLRLMERPPDPVSETIFVRQSIPNLFEREGFFSIGVTAWETTGIHRLWRDWCNTMDAVGVPSRMNVWAFARSGVYKPVELLRYGVDDLFISPGEYRDPLKGLKTPPFRFLSIFEWIHRKGYDVLIRAFLEEFSSDDGVCLVIKTGFDGSRAFNKKVSGDMRRLNNMYGPRGYSPPVFLLSEEMTPAEMLNLYRSCQCFVLPSRGEGAGLPFLEAGSLGMPVISTGWGGQTDFLDNNNSFPVEFHLTPVTAQSHCPYYLPDQKWAEPSVADLKAKMRWVLENYGLALERGSLLRSLVRSEYTWEKAALDVVAALERLTGRIVL
ncbi:MAG: glycosyltransferase family 4 protein [Bacillota bacterium]